jgi:hypothetical protein
MVNTKSLDRGIFLCRILKAAICANVRMCECADVQMYGPPKVLVQGGGDLLREKCSRF